MSEEEFSDPKTRDIRNKAFWEKISETLQEAMEMLREEGKELGVDLDSPASPSEIETMRQNDEAAKNHVISRAARSYGKMVGDWFKKREGLFFETGAGTADESDFEEALEVVRWYQYFVAAKVIRAVHGMREEAEDVGDEFPSDSDGAAKIALIAVDRSIGAWAVIFHHDHRYAEETLKMISFLDRLRQAVEQTFPKARLFLRPGFDRID
jgi:hypothetical protein